ncbi:MAG: hypothetical protein IPM96_08015 [Ignavibacteria bacterium]|nr:hypothetical protein [Ignavibacteria bacterium]
MLKKTHLITTFIVFLFLTLSYSNVFALYWYQHTSINNDKSGTIKIFYKTANSELKEAYIDNFFPFSEEKIKEIFSSDNNIIQDIAINKKKQDSTFVNITISFKDINKINTASAFSNVKITWYKNADSTIFIYKADKNDVIPDNIDASCTFELPAKEIVGSSGTKKAIICFLFQLNHQISRTVTLSLLYSKIQVIVPIMKLQLERMIKEQEKAADYLV